MIKVTVGQLREALKAPKPVLRVAPSQDKIRMEHYVPLHPQVVEAIQPLLDGRQDDELMFQHSPSGCGSSDRRSICRTSKGISCSATFANSLSSMATSFSGISQIEHIS